MYLEKITCDSCDFEIGSKTPVTECPDCGSPLKVHYDLDRMKRGVNKDELFGNGIDRYREFLPLNDSPISQGEGGTPVIKSSFIASDHPGDLYFKLEFTNPTGSFKDRGAAMTVSKACEWGVEAVADDSSGNAGAALAGYSAQAGLDCTIYVPDSASGGKIVQIRSYGAELNEVPGPREKATERIYEDTSETDIYYASHNLSPYFTEGMKTIAYEISEEFGWEPPEHMVVPVGGGALLVGIHNGFRELVELGWIEKVPRLHGVQTEACNPVVKAFNNSRNRTRPVDVQPTVAEGAHISNPDRGKEILDAIRKTEGRALEVTETEVKEALRLLAEKEGLFAEPTSALPVAAIEKLRDEGVFSPGDRVMVPITGSGLKDVKAWKSF